MRLAVEADVVFEQFETASFKNNQDVAGSSPAPGAKIFRMLPG